MGKEIQVAKFADSLKEFLMNAMADRHNNAKSSAARYNNMKVFFDPESEENPHFFVSVGISEACFSIEDGTKIDGAIGAEDGYIGRWSQRTNIKGALEEYWKTIEQALEDEEMKKEIEGEDEFFDDGEESEDDEENTMDIEDIYEGLDLEDETGFESDMMGTGINKVKKEILESKRQMRSYFSSILRNRGK